MNNELLLLSGCDIPFIEAHAIIHPPKIKEIGLIGEKEFNVGCQFLNFSKDLLSEQDKSLLTDTPDFEIFMSVMNTKEKVEYRTDALMLLSLLFPNYKIKFEKDKILFSNDTMVFDINKYNYDAFKDIIQSIFCLNQSIGGDKEEYNPADGMARRIAEKFKKRKQQLNQMKGNEDTSKISIYTRYVSILAVGLRKDMNELMNYTVYQLIDEFVRFTKKQDFDMYIQAKMAGASDIDEVDNWMGDIHS